MGVFVGECLKTETTPMSYVDRVPIGGFWEKGMISPKEYHYFDLPKGGLTEAWPADCFIAALSACYFKVALPDDSDWNTLKFPSNQFMPSILFHSVVQNLIKVKIDKLVCLDKPNQKIPDNKWWGRPYPHIEDLLSPDPKALNPYRAPEHPLIEPGIIPRKLPRGIPEPSWWRPAIQWMEDIIRQINVIGERVREHVLMFTLFTAAIGIIILGLFLIGAIIPAPLGFAKVLAGLAIIVGICQSLGLEFQFSNPTFNMPDGSRASLMGVYEQNKTQIAELIQDIKLTGTLPVIFKMKVASTDLELNLKDALMRYRSSQGFVLDEDKTASEIEDSAFKP